VRRVRHGDVLREGTGEPMSIIVIGVDPGKSAGVAELVNGKLMEFSQGTPETAEDHLERLLGQYAGQGGVLLTVACERYVQAGRQITSHQPEAQQMIGVVARLADQHGARLALQMPADAHKIAPDGMLRRFGMLPMPKDIEQPDADDVRMAIRHAVLCIARRHARLFDNMLAATAR
jgi:hypothetical protein